MPEHDLELNVVRSSSSSICFARWAFDSSICRSRISVRMIWMFTRIARRLRRTPDSIATPLLCEGDRRIFAVSSAPRRSGDLKDSVCSVQRNMKSGGKRSRSFEPPD
jgi:hypothetical protein